MSLWSWLTGSGQSSSLPRPPIEPLPPAVEQKQGSLVGSINSLAFPQPLLYAALGGYASNTGVPVTPLTALQSTVVYGCAKCISEDIAGLKVQIRRRLVTGGWIVDPLHRLNRVLRHPNKFQSRFQFWAYVLTSYCLRGNAFIYIERDQAGNPVELIPVSPDRVTVRLSPETGLLWYRINSLHIGFGVLVPPEDMLHMKNISIDGYLGLSPIACAQDAIGLALAAQQHGAILFRQGGQISGVLKHPGRLSKEAADNIAESWRDTHSGVQNAHKAAVLEEGMTFEKIAITNEDAQFLQTRQFQVADICRLYRVPPNKVGDYGRATFSNIEQQQLQYKDDCLEPHTDQLRDLMNEQLLFDDERDVYEVYWDYTSMLTGSLTQRYQAYQIGLLNGFLNRNEVRVTENMNPIPGGDEYRVPLNTAADDPNPMHGETIGQQIPREDDNGTGDRDEI
jgi:HK97 family phage portal protein